MSLWSTCSKHAGFTLYTHTTHIFKALPETKISGEWLMEELWKWIPSPWCCLCQLT